jgi:pyruvate dehydrogenase E2 component (dihydrolipoamide acetyltransferase)
MDVKLPNLGEGADSGTVVNLLVKTGDSVNSGQGILELENEKAVATIPAPSAGVVGQIYVKVGDRVTVGQRLLALGEAGVSPAKGETSAAKPATPKPPAEAEAQPQPSAEAKRSLKPRQNPRHRGRACDLALDSSRRAGVRPRSEARAPGSRRTNPHRGRAGVPRTTPESGFRSQGCAGRRARSGALRAHRLLQVGEISRQPQSMLGKVIARRMVENWNAIPHVTQFDEVDMTRPLELLKKFAPAYEAKGTRLTFTAFVLKAVAATLQKHPLFNSSLDEAASEIVLKKYVHLGLAVDTEAGLIVPVLRDADKKSLLELSRAIEELAKKAVNAS